MNWFGAKSFVALLVVVFVVSSSGADAMDTQTEVGERRQVSQYGITWEFDRPALSGRFITGDWWVVGPVNIVRITPAPGPAPQDAEAEIKRDQWGNTSMRDDNRMRNGSMVILECGPGQAYDSRSAGYDPALGVTLPHTLEVNRSLVSTVSNEDLTVPNFCRKIMWQSEQQQQAPLRAAAVLTCLEEQPPADAFRPPYAGSQKPIYPASEVRWGRLLRLAPAGEMPSWDEFERYFQRPWLDHIPSWVQRGLSPSENQPAYGREHGRLVSIAALMVHLDVPRERKETLTLRLVQLGIDLSGLAKVGGNYNHGGGHGSGRKWPLLFASLMLGAPELRDLPETAVFHEDAQTYYGKGWFGQTALWQMVTHHGPREPYEEKHPSEWERWDKTSEGYRVCCNAVAWIGTALAARMMEAVEIWEHDAFFDYCDRWMRPDDPYAEARGDYGRPRGETQTFDPFVTAMWRAYRDGTPEQPYSGRNYKWVWEDGEGKWVPNPRPTDR